jgi:CheY-like chemotaxis protein
LDKEIKEYIEIIDKAARDGAEIVKRIKKLSISDESVNGILEVGEVVISAILITKPVWCDGAQVKGKNISLMYDIQPNLYVIGNENEMREAIVNIIINSVDAIEGNGKIEIRVYEKNNNVFIEIKDSGHGMCEEIRKRIFEPFYSTKGKLGSGLGLSIVHETILKMNGKIDVCSKVGKGTTFIIAIPATGSAYALSNNKKDRIKSRNLKILVVDDQLEICKVVKEMLMMNNVAEVHYVTNASEALKMNSENKYDIVLTDLAMPEINGIILVRKIREINDKVKTVLMTGWIDDLPEENKKSVDYILLKPFTLSDIEDMIDKIYTLKENLVV